MNLLDVGQRSARSSEMVARVLGSPRLTMVAVVAARRIPSRILILFLVFSLRSAPAARSFLPQ